MKMISKDSKKRNMPEGARRGESGKQSKMEASL